MKKRELFLVVALILFGLIYQGVEKGRLAMFGDFYPLQGDSRLLSDRYVDFSRPSQHFPQATELEVINPAGEIEVTKTAGAQSVEALPPNVAAEATTAAAAGIIIAARVRVYHERQKDAEAIARTISVSAQSQNNGVRLEVHGAGDFPLNRVRVFLKIQVPVTTRLTLTNSFGNLHLRDVGREVRLNENYGHLFVENIPSSLRVESRHGNLLIKNVAGRTEIRSRYADMNIEDTAALQVENAHGKMVVKNIRGIVHAEHAYGGFFLDGAENVVVDARHVELELRNVRNGVKIGDSYEKMKLFNVGGDIRISGRYCTIGLDQCSAGVVVIGNTFSTTDLQNVSATTLDITQKHGRVSIQLDDLRERLNVSNSYADIDVTLPPALDPSCSLKTEFGLIENRTPLFLEFAATEDERSAKRSGKKGLLVIHNSYGNIRLRNP